MDQLFTVLTDMWHFLQKGGVIMIPLLFCSVFGLAILLVKVIQLRRNKVLAPEIIQLLRSIKTPEDADLAWRISQEKSSPFSNVIQVALANRDLPPEEMKESIEAQGRQEARTLERGLVVLETIAAVAPLLGLLGTVLGMVEVFNELAKSDMVQATQLSHGISKALITTIVGLSIGIVALVFYNYLWNKADSLILDIEKHSATLYNKLRRFKPSETAAEI
ncbi:MotA/TolQ/ExbB proton channel family protein [candidate division CSSED10-310 bacterium]|uniref:MotA/TolQ/ExbB proton channel family protein n=1 Tax=candidate division CSSED10-310 bacterium TaxID=2855610 RepID=A0ABV6YR64_UNCC1